MKILHIDETTGELITDSVINVYFSIGFIKCKTFDFKDNSYYSIYIPLSQVLCITEN